MLVDSASVYEITFERHPLPAWVYDTGTLRILEVNAAAVAHYGYSRADFLSMTLEDIRPEEDAPRLRDVVRGFVGGRGGGGRHESGVWRHRRRDGSLIDVKVVSAPVPGEGGALRIAFVTDITARLRAERERDESESRFEALADVAPVLIWRADPDGRCVYVNHLWQELTGRDTAEALGGGWVNCIHPDDRARVARANAAAKASHRPYTAEYRLLRAQPAADGRDTWLWVLDTGVPRYDPDGRFLGYVGTCVDISERRAQEREKAAFLRDVLASVTEGRLRLCEQPSDLPAPLPALPGASGDSLTLTEETLYLLRRRIRETGAALGFPPERTADLMSAAHEAAMNAVQHGGGAASARLHAAPDGSRMQVWVQDRGAGIRVADLPKATLLRGHSGRGGFGHGYVLILSYADAVHLLTGPGGTTVVLEQACCESPRGEW